MDFGLSTMSKTMDYGVSTEIMDHAVTTIFTSDSEKEVCLISEPGEFVPWNNPDNIISQQAEKWLTSFISVVAIPLLWAVGSAGNVLSAMAFYRQGLRHRVNVCVVCLAVVDLLSVTVLFLLYAEGAWRIFIGPSHFFITYIVGLTGFNVLSQFLSTVIAAERCFCVVRPFMAQRLLTVNKMVVFLAAVSVILMGGYLTIVGPKHTVACLTDPATNVTERITYVTSYYLENQVILDIFDVFVFTTAFPFFFALVIMVTTVITSRTLASATQQRLKMTTVTMATISTPEDTSAKTSPKHNTALKEAALKEVALTRMLLATSLLFLLCVAPSLAVQVSLFVVEELRYGGRHHNLVAALWALVSLFKVVNSSMNFFIYYTMGTKFRETVKEILSCGSARSASADPSTRSSSLDPSSVRP